MATVLDTSEILMQSSQSTTSENTYWCLKGIHHPSFVKSHWKENSGVENYSLNDAIIIHWTFEKKLLSIPFIMYWIPYTLEKNEIDTKFSVIKYFKGKIWNI